jgi:hypothetical protein
MLAAVLRVSNTATGTIGAHVMVADMANNPPALSILPSIYGHASDSCAVASMCASDEFLKAALTGRHIRHGVKALVRALLPNGASMEPPPETFCHQWHLDCDHVVKHWCYNEDFTTSLEDGAPDFVWARLLPLKAGGALAATLDSLALRRHESDYQARKTSATANYNPYLEPLVLPDDSFQPRFFAKPASSYLPWQVFGSFRGVSGLFWRSCYFLNDDGTTATPRLRSHSVAIPYRVVFWLATSQQNSSARVVLRHIYNMNTAAGPHALSEPADPVPRRLFAHSAGHHFIKKLESALRINIFEDSTPTVDLLEAGLFGAALERRDYEYTYRSTLMRTGEMPQPPDPPLPTSSAATSAAAAPPGNPIEATAPTLKVGANPNTADTLPAAAAANAPAVHADTWDPQVGLQLPGCTCSHCSPTYSPTYSPQPFDPSAPSSSAAAEAAFAASSISAAADAAIAPSTAAAAARLTTGFKRVRPDTPHPDAPPFRMIKIEP